MEELLKRLQNGDTPEDLAAEFAAKLNAAEAEKAKIEEAQAKENQKKEENQQIKRDMIAETLECIADYVEIFYGDQPDLANFAAEFADVTDEELDDIIREIDIILKAYSGMRSFKFAKIWDFFD